MDAFWKKISPDLILISLDIALTTVVFRRRLIPQLRLSPFFDMKGSLVHGNDVVISDR